MRAVYNPETKQSIKVEPDQVNHYIDLGWKVGNKESHFK